MFGSLRKVPRVSRGYRILLKPSLHRLLRDIEIPPISFGDTWQVTPVGNIDAHGVLWLTNQSRYRTQLQTSPYLAGVKTMIQILSESNRIGDNCDGDSSTGSTLSTLEIKRLVLQPMDARLEYVHDLRKWLRGNGWHITQVSACNRDKRGHIPIFELHPVPPSLRSC